MSTTSIEWADRVWNPVTGCRKVSPGCANCYAETVADRFWETQYPPVIVGIPGGDELGRYSVGRPRRFTDVQTHPDRLDAPLRWRKPSRVFVNSMSDLFHEDVPDEFILRVFLTMGTAMKHTFLVLTKRPERMRDLVSGYLRDEMSGPDRLPYPLGNVWLGVSVEDQERADERIPILLDTPAAVRFVSCEPMLGPVDLRPWLVCKFPYGPNLLNGMAYPRSHMTASLSWVIFGGESGHGARPCDVDWIRDGVRQCREADVAAFVKQLGANPIEAGPGWRFDQDRREPVDTDTRPVIVTHGKGGDPAEWPEDLRVREFPT